jgi:predicted protein tyrosine phosphatase
MGKIIICRADEMVQKKEETKPSAVLSIEYPGVMPEERGAAPRLDCGTPQLILSLWDSEHVVAGGPDMEQVEQGIVFILEHISRGDVIVHCHAGKSRSVAVALGALALLHPQKSEDALIDILLDIRPIAAPNIIIVEMVDELTGRDGKLLQAVRDHEKITAARERTEARRKEWLENNPETYRKMHPEKFPPP